MDSCVEPNVNIVTTNHALNLPIVSIWERMDGNADVREDYLEMVSIAQEDKQDQNVTDDLAELAVKMQDVELCQMVNMNVHVTMVIGEMDSIVQLENG